MFTFFRKIRQKLITEGKLKNYLFYALGEVLLIIVGILIALQISNWNEQRKVMDKHQVYLTNLHKDVQLTIEGLNNFEQWINHFNASTMPVIDFLDSEQTRPIDKEAFEKGIRNLPFSSFPQVYIGLLGQLLEGDTELININPLLAKSALKMESEVEINLEVVSRIAESFHKHVADTQHYLGYLEVNSKMQIHYDLPLIKKQPQFKYAVMNIITSRKGMMIYSNKIRDVLEMFQKDLEKTLNKKVN